MARMIKVQPLQEEAAVHEDHYLEYVHEKPDKSKKSKKPSLAEWDTPYSPYNYSPTSDQDGMSQLETPKKDRSHSQSQIRVSVNEMIISAPPTGHFGDLMDDDQGQDYVQVEGQFVEEKFEVADSSTLLGRVTAVLSLPKAQQMDDEENQETVKNGASLLHAISDVPLNECWQKFTEYFMILVFLASIAAAIYDIVIAPVLLHWKVTCLVLGVIENFVVWGMALISYHPKFKNAKDIEQKKKNMQYVENILHEIILYASILTMVIAFSNDKMYNKPSNIFGWCLIALLIITLIDLFYTQSLRVYMVYKLFRDIQKILKPFAQPKAFTTSFGAILPRAYVSIMGNIVVFLEIMVFFGVQVDVDNLESSDYHLTLRSGVLMIMMVVFPILSLILFALANSYWAMEILIAVSLAIGENSEENETMSQLKEQYGEIMSDAMGMACSKAGATKKRLDILRNVSNIRKVFYPLTYFPVLFLIFLWGCLMVVTILSFGGFRDPTMTPYFVFLFIATVFLVNIHLFIVMLASVIIIILLVISIILYPISLVLCIGKKFTANDDYVVLKNK